MSRTKKDKKILPRSGTAVAAMHRNSGGPMKHRLAPKKGAKNDQPELLGELISNSIEHCGGTNCGIHQDDITSMKFCVCECHICSDIDDGTTDFIDKQLKRDG